MHEVGSQGFYLTDIYEKIKMQLEDGCRKGERDESRSSKRFGATFSKVRRIVMKNILEYKGYHTRIEFDSESLVVRGKIEGIKDYVDFESADLTSIEKEFHDAVDDYLEFCKEVGKEPDKEYKGTFNIRITPELHKRLAVVALINGDTLNATVEKAIQEYVSV